jgi:hypothetical protein
MMSDSLRELWASLSHNAARWAASGGDSIDHGCGLLAAHPIVIVAAAVVGIFVIARAMKS